MGPDHYITRIRYENGDKHFSLGLAYTTTMVTNISVWEGGWIFRQEPSTGLSNTFFSCTQERNKRLSTLGTQTTSSAHPFSQEECHWGYQQNSLLIQPIRSTGAIFGSHITSRSLSRLRANLFLLPKICRASRVHFGCQNRPKPACSAVTLGRNSSSIRIMQITRCW